MICKSLCRLAKHYLAKTAKNPLGTFPSGVFQHKGIYIHKRLHNDNRNHCKSWDNFLFYCWVLQLLTAANHSPRGLTLAWTAIHTARHRLALRRAHCCDNCVRMLSSNLPHKPVKIRYFFDADSPTLNYTRHSCSTAPDAGHVTKLIVQDRMSGTQTKKSTPLVAFHLQQQQQCRTLLKQYYESLKLCWFEVRKDTDLMVCMVSITWVEVFWPFLMWVWMVVGLSVLALLGACNSGEP